MKINRKTAPAAGFGDVVQAMREAPILVVGDIMLDRFVYGAVERISPESPVPVLSITREEIMLGGAGNALANLAGLKAKGVVLSLVGDDENGHLVARQIKDRGLSVEGLLTDAARPTIVKTRFLAGHQQLLRTDFEDKKVISDQMAKAVIEKAGELMPAMKGVILSDYGKGLLRPDVIAALIKLAKKNKIPVVIDPKGRDFSRYKGADVITPNKKELSEATKGMPVETDDEIEAAANTLIKQCGLEAVLATRSADGMSIISKGKPAVHIRSPKDIEVFDVSGAGDTVIATLGAALAAGADLEKAAALANLAGSIVVTKVGTAAIRADELSGASLYDGAHQAPLCDLEEAGEHLKRWRTRGLKIGFTNGCFDILHAGHTTYLAAARGECDRLIVGLNNDASVRLLKGEGRPVNGEDSRAVVLGALACVDMVVLFGAEKEGADNTANEILKMLKPDVYFKGGDYKENEIPEAPTVKAYGGQVHIMPEVEGQSTTNTIKKAKSEAA